MRVGIIQSNYFPWRGYFDFISKVDLFVFHDDIQYTKGDWRNRNRIKTPNGPRWITVPVRYKTTSQLICETEIDESTDWRKQHLNLFAENYRKAPFFDLAHELLASCLRFPATTISELNVNLLRETCSVLGIDTETMLSSELGATGVKTKKLIQLLTSVGATSYLSGPSARGYLDEGMFADAGIELCYMSYDYPRYPQLWGGYDDALSILDLIANTGPSARKFMDNSGGAESEGSATRCVSDPLEARRS